MARRQWGASGPGIWPFSAVRRGRWKLIYDHARGRFELYDLELDVGEASDLAAERPQLVASLAEELSVWIERVGADMSIVRETGDPVPLPREVAR